MVTVTCVEACNCSHQLYSRPARVIKPKREEASRPAPIRKPMAPSVQQQRQVRRSDAKPAAGGGAGRKYPSPAGNVGAKPTKGGRSEKGAKVCAW